MTRDEIKLWITERVKRMGEADATDLAVAFGTIAGLSASSGSMSSDTTISGMAMLIGEIIAIERYEVREG